MLNNFNPMVVREERLQGQYNQLGCAQQISRPYICSTLIFSCAVDVSASCIGCHDVTKKTEIYHLGGDHKQFNGNG